VVPQSGFSVNPESLTEHVPISALYQIKPHAIRQMRGLKYLKLNAVQATALL
jgi:hypothetical protein